MANGRVGSKEGVIPMSKITSLTEEQKAQFPDWVKRYTETGLSCEPADKPRAERGVRAHYACAKIECPETMVWVSSPLVISIASPVAAYLIENGRPVSRGALGGVIDKTFSSVSPDIRAAVVAAVVAAGATGEGEGRNTDIVRALRQAVSTGWSRHNGGAWWISFVAWATFMRDVLGCDIPIGPREDTDSSCGWWWPHRQFVMLCDRPKEIHRDVDGRLHSPSGPSISWRDGWGLYFWRGTRVPREWIENPGGIDPTLALNHANVELRRCAAEIVGWEKVLRLLNPTTIQKDPDPEIGELLEVEVAGVRERFIKVRCGTGRTFVLPVPPEMQTALEANAWTYGVDAVDLRGLETRT